MTTQALHLITGAYGYSGQHIAQALLAKGQRVETITGHPDRPHPLRDRVPARLLQFEDEDKLVEALRGAEVLYNTYWVRFDHGQTTHALAVAQLETLFRAAQRAEVQRVVHVSITNPTADSPLPYFNGKARVEAALQQSGLSHAILRPAVFFGGRDVLISNIAWLLRRAPLFGVAGADNYGLQPIHIDDMARLAVEAGERGDNYVLDAVGPETFGYRELVRLVATAIGRKARIVRLPRWLLLATSRVLGWWLKDRVLTADELDGLMANLLVSAEDPPGRIRFTDWLSEHADELGTRWANELGRHYR